MTALMTLLCLLTGETTDASDRTAFDFLVGTWELDQRIDHTRKTSERGDDRYVFRQPIPGGAIEATWRFNRGTRDEPDYADALYISGYHNPSKSWSFYYVSERSAQYWRGRQTDGVGTSTSTNPSSTKGARRCSANGGRPSTPLT